MVLRRDERGVLAVGQAAHAWLCGQLARAWGNPQFDPVVPLAGWRSAPSSTTWAWPSGTCTPR